MCYFEFADNNINVLKVTPSEIENFLIVKLSEQTTTFSLILCKLWNTKAAVGSNSIEITLQVCIGLSVSLSMVVLPHWALGRWGKRESYEIRSCPVHDPYKEFRHVVLPAYFAVGYMMLPIKM